jgi:hypothetical protein
LLHAVDELLDHQLGGAATLEAVTAAYAAAGTTGIHTSSPLDRCLRDATTAVQHICTQQSNYELAGRLRLGRLEVPNPLLLDTRA